MEGGGGGRNRKGSKMCEGHEKELLLTISSSRESEIIVTDAL